MRRCLLPTLVTILLLSASPLKGQEYVWLEGESPARSTVKFDAAGWGRQEFLSGGKWLFGNIDAKDIETKVPADGAVLTYPFELQKGGDFEVWVRLGYEFVRSPFRWRLDEGDWKESKSD